MINKDNWKNYRSGYNWIMKPEDDSFMVSYLPPDWKWRGSAFSDDKGTGETALVKGEVYYILNGDWTSQYEPLVHQGFESCLKLYEDNKAAHNSSWSTLG